MKRSIDQIKIKVNPDNFKKSSKQIKKGRTVIRQQVSPAKAPQLQAKPFEPDLR